VFVDNVDVPLFMYILSQMIKDDLSEMNRMLEETDDDDAGIKVM
jgi:hypothetical protein